MTDKLSLIAVWVCLTLSSFTGAQAQLMSDIPEFLGAHLCYHTLSHDTETDEYVIKINLDLFQHSSQAPKSEKVTLRETFTGVDIRPITLSLDSVRTSEKGQCQGDHKAKVYHAFYSAKITLDRMAGGYSVLWETCCVGTGIMNFDLMEESGLMLSCQIPDPAELKNSSPRISVDDYVPICQGEAQVFPMQVLDKDGDKLSVSIAAPLHRLDKDAFEDGAEDEDGIGNYVYRGGFGNRNPLGSGKIQFDPNYNMQIPGTSQGYYLLAITATESRNGRTLGMSQRIQLFLVN